MLTTPNNTNQITRYLASLLVISCISACLGKNKDQTHFVENSSNLIPTTLFDMQVVESQSINYNKHGFFGNFKLKSTTSFPYLDDGEYHFLINNYLAPNGNFLLSLSSEESPDERIDIELLESNDAIYLNLFNIRHKISAKINSLDDSYFMRLILRIKDGHFEIELLDEVSQENLFESANIPIIFDTKGKKTNVELNLEEAGILFFKHYKTSAVSESAQETQEVSDANKKFDPNHLVLSQEILYKKFLSLNLQNPVLIHSLSWIDETYVYAKLRYSFEEKSDRSSKIDTLAIACHFHGQKFACHKKDPNLVTSDFETSLDTSISPEENIFEDLNSLETEELLL